MSIRNLASPPVKVDLADGSSVSFVRMTVTRWAELADQIRRKRIGEELKLIGAEKDPETRQRMRLRAHQFEPSLRNLIAYAESPAGIRELLTYAATGAGETPARAADVLNIIAPADLFTLVDELIHAPAVKTEGPSEPVEGANPTSAGGSSETTGESSSTDGSSSPNPPTGSISPDEFGPPTASTPAA